MKKYLPIFLTSSLILFFSFFIINSVFASCDGCPDSGCAGESSWQSSCILDPEACGSYDPTCCVTTINDGCDSGCCSQTCGGPGGSCIGGNCVCNPEPDCNDPGHECPTVTSCSGSDKWSYQCITSATKCAGYPNQTCCSLEKAGCDNSCCAASCGSAGGSCVAGSCVCTSDDCRNPLIGCPDIDSCSGSRRWEYSCEDSPECIAGEDFCCLLKLGTSCDNNCCNKSCGTEGGKCKNGVCKCGPDCAKTNDTCSDDLHCCEEDGTVCCLNTTTGAKTCKKNCTTSCAKTNETCSDTKPCCETDNTFCCVNSTTGQKSCKANCTTKDRGESCALPIDCDSTYCSAQSGACYNPSAAKDTGEDCYDNAECKSKKCNGSPTPNNPGTCEKFSTTCKNRGEACDSTNNKCCEDADLECSAVSNACFDTTNSLNGGACYDNAECKSAKCENLAVGIPGTCKPSGGGEPNNPTYSDCPKEGLVPCGTPDCPCQFCHFFVMFKRILDFILFRIVPLAAVLLVVSGGAMLIFGGVNPKLVAQGKSILTSVAVGLIIIYAAWIIVNTVLTIPGLMNPNFGGWRPENWFQIDCKLN
ncbi:MAG: pilin [Candidatus Pacebacteria bacterium]|nr:pilin [Candidatus Paceibacterota bacterium]